MNETEGNVSEDNGKNMEANKKELGRKFFVFLVWVILVVAIAVLVGLGRAGENIFSQALNSFYVISIVYIGGNVAQKVGKYASDAISEYTLSKKEKEGEK